MWYVRLIVEVLYTVPSAVYKQYGSDFINKRALGSQQHNEYITQLPCNQKPIAISEYIIYIDGVDKNYKLFHYSN